LHAGNARDSKANIHVLAVRASDAVAEPRLQVACGGAPVAATEEQKIDLILLARYLPKILQNRAKWLQARKTIKKSFMSSIHGLKRKKYTLNKVAAPHGFEP